MRPSSPSAERQRGAALIVALIFLIALSLLGASATTNNTLQERMAGNTRNRDIAFEAAEHALEAADGWIDTNALTLETAATSIAGDGVRDHGETHANDSAYWLNTFDWTSSDLKTAAISGPASPPKYVIEKMPDDASGKPYYRVTARAVGAGGKAVVILQTMYVITH